MKNYNSEVYVSLLGLARVANCLPLSLADDCGLLCIQGQMHKISESSRLGTRMKNFRLMNCIGSDIAAYPQVRGDTVVCCAKRQTRRKICFAASMRLGLQKICRT